VGTSAAAGLVAVAASAGLPAAPTPPPWTRPRFTRANRCGCGRHPARAAAGAFVRAFDRTHPSPGSRARSCGQAHCRHRHRRDVRWPTTRAIRGSGRAHAPGLHGEALREPCRRSIRSSGRAGTRMIGAGGMPVICGSDDPSERSVRLTRAPSQAEQISIMAIDKCILPTYFFSVMSHARRAATHLTIMRKGFRPDDIGRVQ